MVALLGDADNVAYMNMLQTCTCAQLYLLLKCQYQYESININIIDCLSCALLLARERVFVTF